MILNSHGENLAAIDIGTNSFHLIIVKIKEDGNFEIIDREKEVIRLGEGNTGDIKKINSAASDRAITALKRFKGLADSYGADIRAVATSAVRESENKNTFISRVAEETGIEVEVISGYEEARLIYLGVLKAVPIYKKWSLVVDIGGGSTEILLGYKGIPQFAVSLKLGAVRLSQMFFPDYMITEKRIKECRDWVEGELFHISDIIKGRKFEIAVGSSGTIMAVGNIIGILNNPVNPTAVLNNFQFNHIELNKVYSEIISHKSLDKRKKIKGLDADRADIIPAGIIILKTIFDFFELECMTVSGYALREGIILDTLQKTSADKSVQVISDIRRASVEQLAKSCRYNLEHCRHITKLALKLFDELKPLHNLKDDCREFLEAAALLHDIGYHIAHTNHHHHSYYIIKNSELLGFTEREIGIIAHTARYHRKSHPKSGHEDFVQLPVPSQIIIKKLAAILRVADSFDRTHRKIINDFSVHIKQKSVNIILRNIRDLQPDIELWNLNRRKALFEEVFERNLVVSNN